MTMLFILYIFCIYLYYIQNKQKREGKGAGCAQINIIYKNYQVSYSHFEGVLYVSVRVHANANHIFVCLFV